MERMERMVRKASQGMTGMTGMTVKMDCKAYPVLRGKMAGMVFLGQQEQTGEMAKMV